MAKHCLLLNMMGENPAEDFLDVSRLNFEGPVEDQIDNLLSHVRLSRDEVIGLRTLLSDLELAFMNVWPNCEVQPFGSIVTGLGIRSSDFDVYVRIPYPQRRINPVNIARNILKNTPWKFTNVYAIPHAKVPIVKFNHTPTGCNCDLNFKGLNGVRNSKLIYQLFQTDPRALKLAIIVKYWAKVFNLTGTNLLANYALTMLVIFYLQSIEMLAPVVEMQRAVEPFLVDYWNTAFDKDTNQPNQNEDDLYDLLGGFFKYYSVFRFDTNVVSTYMGVPVDRSIFGGPLESVPEEYSFYKENLRQKIYEPLRTDTLMCVQDPFEHNRNCTVALSPKLFHKIMFHIRNAANMYDQMRPDDFLKAVFTINLPKQTSQPINTHANHIYIIPTIKKKKRKNKKKTQNIAKMYAEIINKDKNSRRMHSVV